MWNWCRDMDNTYPGCKLTSVDLDPKVRRYKAGCAYLLLNSVFRTVGRGRWKGYLGNDSEAERVILIASYHVSMWNMT